LIEKISDRISMIFTDEGFTFSNCVLVEDDTRVMIDSGAGSILETVRPADIDLLLLSHHHLDHIKGNDYFTRARVMAHPLERTALQDPEKTTATHGWQELIGGDALNYAQELGAIQPRLFEPWRVDEDLHDNQVIDCGNTSIRVMHTPGHTAGHCSFYFPDEGFIFTGDICLTKVGPWYGDPDTDIEDTLNSINRIIELRPRILATGHVPYVIREDITQKLTNYRDRIFKREKRILKHISEYPSSIHEIAEKKLIYPVHPSTFVLFWEKSMIKKHLERLEKNGMIEYAENDRYTAKIG